MIARLLWVAGLAVWPGLGLAQDAPVAPDDTIIDLTPMLDLMQAPPETTPPITPPPPPEPAPEPPAATPAETAPTAAAAPPAPAPALPSVIEAPVRAGVPAAETPDESEAVRIPLRSSGGTDPLRLIGEYDSAEFLIDIADPLAVSALDIVMQSSVNLLPETSTITVTVNDTEAASTPAFAFDGFAPLSLDTAALVAGTNRIGVTVEQSHRIFCGPDATFQLWTEVDASASGATLLPGDHGANAATFASLATGMDSITVIADAPPDPALLSEIARRLAAPDTGRPPAIMLVGPYDAAPNGVIAPRIAIRSDAAQPVALRAGADGGPVLVIAAAAPLDALNPFLPVPPIRADLPDVVPGQPALFADLGMPDIAVRRRYGRVDVPFSLPEDWMLAASQSARIDLLYSYADGLPRNALMLVKVNGTTIRLLPLFGEPGVTLPLLPVGFSTRLLEPGANALTFEFIIPGDPPDQPCSRIDGPLVEIDSGSQIVVPPAPRMAFPSVATLLRSLDMAGISFAEGAAPDGLANAVAQGLVASLMPLDGGPETGLARLTVASLAEIDRLPLTFLGLNRRALEDVLAGRLAMPTAVTEDVEAPGPVARSRSWLADRWTGLRRLGLPGDPALATWLDGQKAVAMLAIPDPADRLSGWLVAAPGVDPVWLADRIATARLDPDGPKGAASLLAADGTWSNWHPAATPPRLLEPLSIANMRTVAGNYAAWSPLLYVALLGALVVVSVIVGLVFVVRTRGRRKR
jgi:hypothetical protein